MLTLEERLQRLEDDAAIRDLGARFADTAVRADYEGFAALWAPNATFTINEPLYASATGTEAIVALLRKLETGLDFFVQFVHSGVVDIRENHATARWILQEVAKGGQEHYYNNYGVFIDEMEKVNGQWLYTRRSYEYLYLDFSPFTGDGYKLLTNTASVG